MKDSKISFRDPKDGAFDMSAFLKRKEGFLPVPILITEPAIGYGGGAAFLFFHPHKGKGGDEIAPNITGAVGLGTQNKTWMAGAFHFHIFGPDKVRSISAFAKPVIHIKYYGNNNDFLSKHPITLNMDAVVALQRIQVKVASTKWFLGGSYVFFRTDNSLDTLPGKPLINLILERLKGASTISMLQPAVNYDSRDNIFTPTKGIYAGLVFSYNSVILGADEDFYKLNTYILGYKPISNTVFSSWRFEGNYLIGDAPLYAYPYIQLRAIPAMRYQSDNTVVVETEWRYEFYKRWSAIAFTGVGKAFKSLQEFDDAVWAYNYGTGIRYKIARAFGLHSGLDLAWGNNQNFAFYIVFGSSWMK